MECKLVQPLWKTVRRFLNKLRIKLAYDPAIPLLVTCPEKTTILKGTGTPVSAAALFTIARTWKQSRYPSTDEWLKKLWYTYTMEYYSAIKKNEIESVTVSWMNLEPVIQSAVSQKEKSKHCTLMYIYGNYKNTTDKPIYREEWRHRHRE